MDAVTARAVARADQALNDAIAASRLTRAHHLRRAIRFYRVAGKETRAQIVEHVIRQWSDSRFEEVTR